MKLLVFPSESLETYDRSGYAGWFPDYFNPEDMFQEVIVCQRESSPRPDLHKGMDVVSVPDVPVWGVFRLFWAGLKLCREEKPDVIRAYNPLGAGLCAVLCQKFTGVPAVISVHNHYGKLLGQAKPFTATRLFGKWLMPWVLRRAAQVRIPSSGLLCHILTQGVSSEKVLVTPNKVRIERFSAGQNGRKARPFTFLYVGRLVEAKNVGALLEAAALLKSEGEKFRLVIVGRGPLRETLERSPAAQSLGEAVNWAGVLPHTALSGAYHEADAFVLPSFFEGFGTVLIEAQASGLPIIASDISETKDIVDKSNALLFDPKDSRALAQSMKRLMSEPKTKERLGRLSEERAKNFSWEKVSQLEKDAYLRLSPVQNPTSDESAGWKKFAQREGWVQGDARYLDALPFSLANKLAPGDTLTWDRHARNFFRVLSHLDLQGKRVLDMGAGRCWSTKYLTLQGAACVAQDLVTDWGTGLESGKHYLNEFVSFDRVRSDMNALPFAKESFDLVFASGSLHHTLDIQATLQETARILKKGGTLALANEQCSSPWGIEDIQRPDMPGINEHCYRTYRLFWNLRRAGFVSFEIIPDVYWLKKSDYAYSPLSELSRVHPFFTAVKLFLRGGVFNLIARKKS